MTTPTANDEQLRAALEQYAANMSPQEFRAFVYRVRPPGEAVPLNHDPAQRMQAMQSSIAAKQAQRPQVDHNGHPLKGTTRP